jgi:DNA-binding PadR family transcriptional regulator
MASYPTLQRMEAEGLLVSRAELLEGRRRRRYRATEQFRPPSQSAASGTTG